MPVYLYSVCLSYVLENGGASECYTGHVYNESPVDIAFTFTFIIECE